MRCPGESKGSEEENPLTFYGHDIINVAGSSVLEVVVNRAHDAPIRSRADLSPRGG